MIVELNRMIAWMENYGLPKEEIAKLLNNLTEENDSPQLEDAAQRLEASLRTVAPDPLDRAKLFCLFLQILPEEEPEPEETVERTQFVTLFLRAVREIVEVAYSREQALEKLDAVLCGK